MFRKHSGRPSLLSVELRDRNWSANFVKFKRNKKYSFIKTKNTAELGSMLSSICIKFETSIQSLYFYFILRKMLKSK